MFLLNNGIISVVYESEISAVYSLSTLGLSFFRHKIHNNLVAAAIQYTQVLMHTQLNTTQTVVV